MANPILTSDLYKDTGELRQLISELEEVQKKYEDLKSSVVDNAVKINVKLKTLNSTTSAQREEIEATSKQAEELAKRYQKYEESLGETAVQIAALKNAQQKLNQVNKLEAKILASKEGSYDKLSAQYSLNKIRLNQMSKAQREATKEGQELEASTRDIYEEMKRLQEATGKHVLSVGDYGKALRDLPGPLNQVKGGMDTLGDAMKAIVRNPLLAVLGLIVGILFTLFNAFKRSAKGAELLAKIGGLLEGVMSVVVSIANDLAEVLVWAFENPKEAVTSLWQTIKSNIVDRLKAVIDLFGAVGRAIYNSLTFNMEGFRKAAVDAGDAVNRVFGDVVTYVKEVAKEVSESAEAFSQLALKQREVANANRIIAKSVEDLTTKEQLYQAIADDVTKSFEERKKAQEDAQRVLEQRAQKEIQIARNNLSLVNAEIDLRRRNGEDINSLLDQQLDAYRSLASAEREYTLSVRENEKVRSELKQDELERDLDILIDGFDNQKTINERRLQDDRITLAERAKILNETKNLADDSFQKQIETIQRFTDIQVNANDLIATSDAVLLNQKIRSLGLSEIIEGRLLEIIRERRVATQDLIDADRELAEATRDERMKQLQVSQLVADADFELTKRTEEEKAQFAIDQKQAELEEIRRLNAEFRNVLPPIDTTQLETELSALKSELSNAIKETRLAAFDEQQALAQSEFDLLEKSEREKTQFRLNAERERLEKIIELNEKYGSDLSQSQLETIRNQIALINAEFDQVSRGVTDIYDLFGFSLSDEKKNALNQAVSFIKDSLSQLTESRLNAANAAVSAANTEVAEAQRVLQAEITKNELGQANREQTARQELAAAKKNQEQAIKEQQKAQQAQNRIQTIEQSLNLATASAKIWSSFAGLGPAGPFLAAGAIATMWTSFIAAKIRASQLAKKTFGSGGLEIIGGGTHASGNDTYLGFFSDGKPAYGERDEAHMVLSAKQSRKYKHVLPDIYKALSQGNFEERFNSVSGVKMKDGISLTINNGQHKLESNRGVEKKLDKLIEHGEHKYYSDNGKIVEKYKNLTRIYE